MFDVRARVQKRRENEATGAPNSQWQAKMNEPVFYFPVLKRLHAFQQIKQKLSVEYSCIVRLLYEWRKIRAFVRWEDSNRMINKAPYWTVDQPIWLANFTLRILPTRRDTQPYWLVNRVIRYMYCTCLITVSTCSYGKMIGWLGIRQSTLE